MARLLIVDDEQSICWGLSQLGASMGHEVATASSAERALELVREIAPDVIVLDVRLPGMDGLAAIEHFRTQLASVAIIVITAYGDLETAVDAVRQGAFDYIVKPFDLAQMERAIVRALSARDPAAETDTVGSGRGYVGDLVGRSSAMQDVFKRIALAAASDANVLICGESGTGKELAARAIHRYSRRSGGPFVAVNVASLSPSLAESELFGHVRSAFTGADVARDGLLVQADGGTLFLDEVAEIPAPIQVKLLRALEYGEVKPVGSNEIVTTNFRVVSATHQNLLERVQLKEFRHDLYFRLCAFQIELPPLRERDADVIELARHFLNEQSDGGTGVLSEEALAELRRRSWQGNVRELRNAIEHAVIMARGGNVLAEHFPPPVSSPTCPNVDVLTDFETQIAKLIRRWAEKRLDADSEPNDLYEQLLRLIEPALMAAALERHHGQCATAARSLGLHRTTLRKKLVEYGIE